MKKNYIFFLFVVLSYTSICFSQKETEKWYYAGSPAPAIDFSSGTPVSLNNSGITFSWESGTSLADANGNLLFYADGNAVCFNRNHVAMTNGTGLIMHNSVTQGCIFVPRPGNPNLYYLFHIGKPSFGSPPFNLYYSEINTTLGGGLGAITATKNISIAASFNNCSEKMTVTKHCNAIDYWLLVHSYTGNSFYAYLITAAGINTVPVITNIGSNYLTQVPNVSEDAVGQMKFSPNGTKLGVMVAGQKIVELYDFNKTTGVISNLINLGNAGSDFPYGVEFSHDNTKVYACGTSNFGNPCLLKQWNLSAGNAAAITASASTIASNVSASSLQMAPNGKIYGAKFATSLLAINNPNVAGVGCGYVFNGLSTAPGMNQLGLPNFITSYFDKPNTYTNASVASINTTNCQNNGGATLTASWAFGTFPYTYTWSTGSVVGPTANLTSSVSNLAPGNYNVIISDAACIKDTLYFTITGGALTPVTQNISICIGNSYTLPGGGTATTSGTYNDTLLASNGCDSVIITNLLVVNSYTTLLNDTICTGATYTLPWGGTASVAGIYSDTVASIGGCDSIINLNLSLSNPVTSSVNASVCTGSNYILPGGTNVNIAGTYIDTLTTTAGCDSVITTILSITLNILITQSPVICAGNTFTLPNGNIVSTSGSWIDTLAAIGGCDSIVTTNLSVSPPVTFNQNQSICAGNNYTLPGGTSVSTAGSYIDTINTTSGCDSIVTTNLIVLPNSAGNQNRAICSNGNFILPDGTIVNTSGTYTSTLAAANGCDSIVTTTLTVNPAPTATISPNVTIIMGTSTTIIAGGGSTYSWSPSIGLDNSNSNSVIASPSITTTYCVLVSSSNGCMDTACVTVRTEIPCPKSENLGLPNAFSPNNDGENDEFCLQGWDNCIANFSIRIYDRWGTKVFESKDPSFCWDGKYKGNTMDAAVFVYYLSAKYQSIETVINKTGNVSLIR